jgi:hypothetical protein
MRGISFCRSSSTSTPRTGKYYYKDYYFLARPKGRIGRQYGGETHIVGLAFSRMKPLT